MILYIISHLLFAIYFEIRFLRLNLLIDTDIKRHVICLYMTITIFNITTHNVAFQKDI